ncbi:hypothetical protein IWQ62_005214 [Dispira parvispora]|uniref:Ribosomal protein S2 n=1 Tax=Dispira parvispora TaxID=1520584 RepID=A0A9W8E191_9FUNG|nr:hypothetical protein IWQ62_005214 [Dispira parvispora]
MILHRVLPGRAYPTGLLPVLRLTNASPCHGSLSVTQTRRTLASVPPQPDPSVQPDTPKADPPSLSRAEVAQRLDELMPQVTRIGSRHTFRHIAPLHQGQLRPNNFTMEQLLAAGLHLGHARSRWNPFMLPFIFGQRMGIHIINLEHTVAHLRRALSVAKEVARQGGLITFIATRPLMVHPVAEAATQCGQYHVNGKWYPGTLTNAEAVLGKYEAEFKSERDDVPVEILSGASSGNASGKDSSKPARRDGAQKVHEQTQAQQTARPFKPDLMIFFNVLENKPALAEARICDIPTIGLVDTDCNPHCVTYPIPANDDSVNGVRLIAALFAKAIQEGNLLRELAWEKHSESLSQKNTKHEASH